MIESNGNRISDSSAFEYSSLNNSSKSKYGTFLSRIISIKTTFDSIIQKIEEIELTDEEKKTYYDMNSNPPVGKYRIFVTKNNYEHLPYLLVNKESLIHEDTILRLQACLNQLKENELSEEDKEFYNTFKEKFINY